MVIKRFVVTSERVHWLWKHMSITFGGAGNVLHVNLGTDYMGNIFTSKSHWDMWIYIYSDI